MGLHIDTVLTSEISFSSFFIQYWHVVPNIFNTEHLTIGIQQCTMMASMGYQKISRNALKNLTKAAIAGELLQVADLPELTSRCQPVGLFEFVQAPKWPPHSQYP